METGLMKAVKDVVHQLQLSLLEGIRDENLLFAAGSVMCRCDFQDVVTERTIAGKCGYPLCGNALPAEKPRKGKYRVSLKEHKVYDLQETYSYCSTSCVVNSRTFAGSLADERSSELNPAKLAKVVRLFRGSRQNSKEDPGKNGDLRPSKLSIQEKTNATKEVSFEEWLGPSVAIEGYIPQSEHQSKPQHQKSLKEGSSSKSKPAQPKNENRITFSDMDFTSAIIFQDEYSVSKSPGSANTLSGKTSTDSTRKDHHKDNKGLLKPSQVPEMFVGSSSDGKSQESNTLNGEAVRIDDLRFSELTLASGGEDLQGNGPEINERVCTVKGSASDIVDIKSSLKSSDSKKLNRSVTWADEKTVGNANCLCEYKESSDKTRICVSEMEGNASDSKKLNRSVTWADEKTVGNASGLCEYKESSDKTRISVSEMEGNASDSKKLNRSVTWADEKNVGNASGLCEYKESGDKTRNSISEMEGNENSYRLASAEALADALIQVSDVVASGKSDVSDAVSEVGLIILPPPQELDGSMPQEDDDNEHNSELIPSKWPSKLGEPNFDLFDSDDSWFEGPPNGFSLELSPFATVFMALFAWISSSSLAYIYGRDESCHEEYLSVNGRDYPIKVVAIDGRSSEIQQTLAGCLSRALPGVVRDLRLPIPVSSLEQGMSRLLDTMSFIEPLPGFRMKQWQLIVLLFLDALSVTRIPPLTPYMTGRRILLPKVLDGASISAEDYEVLKDLIIPLGRAPQFSSQCGG